MNKLYITITNNKKPGEGIMQMVDSYYADTYYFSLEEEEVNMLFDELDYEGIEFMPTFEITL